MGWIHQLDQDVEVETQSMVDAPKHIYIPPPLFNWEFVLQLHGIHRYIPGFLCFQTYRWPFQMRFLNKDPPSIKINSTNIFCQHLRVPIKYYKGWYIGILTPCNPHHLAPQTGSPVHGVYWFLATRSKVTNSQKALIQKQRLRCGGSRDGEAKK